MNASMKDVTSLLAEAAAGDKDSLNKLYERVYEELRHIAARKMAFERPGHTLQATALVHEAFLRVGGGQGHGFENQAHFFSAAAEAMRRILIESARRKRQVKRGGDQERMELLESRIAVPNVDEEKLLEVHEALDTLSLEDPIKAEVVKLRFFVGLNHQQIADALQLSEKTVRRHWSVAKVRLFELISNKSASESAATHPDRS